MNNDQNIKNDLKLALVQVDTVWEDVGANLSQLSAILKGITDQPDLIILPESFATGFSMNAVKVAETMEGESVQWMRKVAADFNCAVGGSLFIREHNNFYNRFIWMNPDGTLQHYNKRHLFSMGDEHSAYTKGEEQTIIHYRGWKIFPQICYDIRFPVWSRNTVNYDLLINVANWPAPRRKVWKTLLKARAIENQCYVAGVNRLGADRNKIEYCGDSMIVGPKGEVLKKAKDQTIILYAAIDRNALHQFRAKFDTLKDGDAFRIFS